MKIIHSDNIPTDMSSEHLYMEDVTKEAGERLCKELNKNLGDNQGPFYRVVDDNHKLYKFEY